MSNIDTGTALRHVLEQNGYTVLLGVDGAEGVDIYDRQRKAIDLVVLDMSMPRHVRRPSPETTVHRHLELKMILCSGHLADNDIAKKVDAVLAKAIKQEHFIRILRQILDGPT